MTTSRLLNCGLWAGPPLPFAYSSKRATYFLSRFAHLRPDQGVWVLEGHNAVQLRILNPQLLTALHPVDLTALGALASLLLAAGFLVQEGEENDLASWERARSDAAAGEPRQDYDVGREPLARRISGDLGAL